jgi:hypothetical protein
MTTVAEFKLTLSKSAPAKDLPPALQALWWAAKENWDKAHRIVMGEDGSDSAWVHAYLHRVEGDIDNARYWYRQARQKAASGPLEGEWDAIAAALIESSRTSA